MKRKGSAAKKPIIAEAIIFADGQTVTNVGNTNTDQITNTVEKEFIASKCAQENSRTIPLAFLTKTSPK
jgi:hypothetical protein